MSQASAKPYSRLMYAVVDRRQTHGSQDPVGHRRGAGNLQEVAAGGMEVARQHGMLSMMERFCIQTAVVTHGSSGCADLVAELLHTIAA